jgi:hypothetical protein
MQLIFDHMVATLIGVTVMIALASTQLRVQQSGVEQVSAHSAKTKALSLGAWLEDDITSLGANFGQNLMRFDLPQTDEHGNSTLWQFYSDSLYEDGSSTRHITRYSLDIVDWIEVADSTRPLYQLHRQTASTPLVNGVPSGITSPQWSSDGRSVATLSTFRIGLVARNGTLTTDPETADFIRVEFAMVPEFIVARGYLHELHWSTLLKVRPFWQQPVPTS